MKSSRAWQLHHVLLLLLAGVFTLVSPKAIPAADLPHDLQRISDFFLLVDGKQVPSEIYQSDRPAAVLVVSPAFPSPGLLMARSAATIPAAAVERKPEGTATLRPDATLTPQGTYEYVDEQVKFSVAGHAAILRQQTPLLGLRHAGEVTAHNPEYLLSAKAYAVNIQEIAALQKETRPVTVRVYFGSWCPHCRRMVPHALRVEQELKASKIRFEYFGLPPNFGSDPEAQKAVIQSLPTGVVFIQGNEVGRLIGDEAWKSPESTLRTILAAKG